MGFPGFDFQDSVVPGGRSIFGDPDAVDPGGLLVGELKAQLLIADVGIEVPDMNGPIGTVGQRHGKRLLKIHWNGIKVQLNKQIRPGVWPLQKGKNDQDNEGKGAKRAKDKLRFHSSPFLQVWVATAGWHLQEGDAREMVRDTRWSNLT